MSKSTHKPPARIRYEQSHPTLSCRLDGDARDLLKQRLEDLGGVSFAHFVKDSLGLLQMKMPDIEKIRETAWGEGYAQAVEDCEKERMKQSILKRLAEALKRAISVFLV